MRGRTIRAVRLCTASRWYGPVERAVSRVRATHRRWPWLPLTALGDACHCSRSTARAGRLAGVAVDRTPLPLALGTPDCAWRRLARQALDRAGRPYRIAYSSEQCAGQEAAMIADLAIAPYPLSLVKPPLKRLEEGPDL